MKNEEIVQLRNFFSCTTYSPKDLLRSFKGRDRMLFLRDIIEKELMHVLYSHMPYHNDTKNKHAGRLLYKYIFLSLYL